MGATKLGLTAKVYVNEGSYDSPSWLDISSLIRGDVSTNLEKGDADVSTRNSSWRAHAGTLKDFSLEFPLLTRPTHPAYLIFVDAFINDTLLDLLVLTGDKDEAGNDGQRAVMQCMGFGRDEPLEDAIVNNISMMTALDDDLHPPVWVTTPV